MSALATVWMPASRPRRLRAPVVRRTGSMCTAIVYVDDATSRLMVVRFAGSESTFAYFEATLEFLKSFGKPLAFYSDKASIFRINQPGARCRHGSGLHTVRAGALRA